MVQVGGGNQEDAEIQKKISQVQTELEMVRVNLIYNGEVWFDTMV